VVVASDGSTDATNEIVAAYADRGVVLLALPRVGKADALTAAVAASHGEILVFTDANTRFAAGAVTALVTPFGDPDVGGAQVLRRRPALLRLRLRGSAAVG
jgi:cellulose synthase/poly-beta-1,6-N-acetylglucosamine synthase-like glycosyltransferase